jgi:hypothetical protein
MAALGCAFAPSTTSSSLYLEIRCCNDHLKPQPKADIQRNILLHTERINKWLTLLANFGVLVGIIFLAIEVRQSNRIAIATTEISVRDQYRSNNELVLANDAVAELLVKAADANAEFSAVETEKLYAYLYVYINTWKGIEIAYENGMLPLSTFDVALDDVRNVLQDYPALRPLAREFMVYYPSEADSNVNKVMREELEDIE